LVLLEDFGVPVPGEIMLIAAAVFAGSGQLNIARVIPVAVIVAVRVRRGRAVDTA
jgi:membrane protein DedA with SNARE-associated domain